jgi:hypothetical protein
LFEPNFDGYWVVQLLQTSVGSNVNIGFGRMNLKEVDDGK